MANLDRELKSQDTTLSTKVHIVIIFFLFFPGVMYKYESWTIKKAECWRIDLFELWCWRRLLRVPWTARRANQSILKEINLECGLTDAEAPILWPPDVKSWLIGKDPDGGKYWRQEEKGETEDDMVGWHSWLNGCVFEKTLGDSEDREDWCLWVNTVGHDLRTE